MAFLECVVFWIDLPSGHATDVTTSAWQAFTDRRIRKEIQKTNQCSSLRAFPDHSEIEAGLISVTAEPRRM